MNSERRRQLLEEFASSKAAEFEGFKAAWLERYPESVVEALVAPEPVVVEVKPKRKRTPAIVEVSESVESESVGE